MTHLQILKSLYADDPELFDIITDGNENENGTSQLLLLVKTFDLIKTKTEKQFDKSFNRLKSYLVSAIKRGLTKDEEYKILKVVVEFIKSDPASEERSAAIKNIMTASYLEPKQITQQK